MSQLNVDTIKNRLGTAGPTVLSLTVTNNVTVGGALTVTGSINTSGIITSTSIVVSAGTTALPSISPTGDTNTGIFFPAADTIAFSEGGTEAMRIKSDGDVSIVTGNLIIGTAGRGIDFSATANSSGTMTSELLNDYEVGTFTPVVSGNAVAGTATYSTQTGEYVKVGRLVTVRALMTYSGHTGSAYLAFGGLPFGLPSSQTLQWDCENIALSAGNQPGIAAYGILYQQPGGASSSFNAVGMDVAGTIYIFGSYIVS